MSKTRSTAPPDRDKVVALPKPQPQPQPEQDKEAVVLPFKRRRPSGCEVLDCAEPHYARQLCKRHYDKRRYALGTGGLARSCAQCGKEQRMRGSELCMTCEDDRMAAWLGAAYQGDYTKLSRRARATVLWNARLKADVFAGYGGRCACCGEAETSMLQLDHVHGRGNQERATHRSNWKGVYIRARREGFPADLQLLCASCNQSKVVLGGRCAHQGNTTNAMV
jgi:hypothetical protein